MPGMLLYGLLLPQIISPTWSLTLLDVWTIFIFHLTHPHSIFHSLSSDPPLSPIAPLDLP